MHIDGVVSPLACDCNSAFIQFSLYNAVLMSTRTRETGLST